MQRKFQLKVEVTPWKPSYEEVEKYIIAVPGTDIEEMINQIKLITKEG